MFSLAARLLRCIALVTALSVTSLGGDIFVVHDKTSGDPVGLTHHGPARTLVTELEKQETRDRLKTVEWVELQQHAISAKEVRSIARLPNIKTLELGYYPDPVELNTEAFRALERFLLLEELAIYGRVVNPDFRILESLPRLRVLSVSRDAIDDSGDLSRIGKHQKLTHVTLETSFPIDDCHWVSSLGDLVALELIAPSIDDSVVDAIRSLPHLESLMLRGIRFNEERLNRLANDGDNSYRHLDIMVSSDCRLKDLSRFPNAQEIFLHCRVLPQAGDDSADVTIQLRFRADDVAKADD